MYEAYFGLSGSPFKLNPDPRYFFGSRSHNKAMAYLHYGLKQAEGFIVITGPVGAGKSMLIGHLLDQLNRSNIVAANLLTSSIEPDDLLGHILSSFRIEPEGEGKTGQLEAFEDYLFDQLNRGKRVLLILDEAQNLPRRTLEELRMLSNIDYDGTPLFQVFLVGQPEFKEIMEASDMEQLRQRVIASYHLENLSAQETKEYILHRLSVAGWKKDPAFSIEAVKAIYAETDGLPRRINTLCNRIMLFCAIEKKHEVSSEIVRKVAAEMRGESAPEEKAVAAAPMRKQANGANVAPDAAQNNRPKNTASSPPRSANVVSIDKARPAPVKEVKAIKSPAPDAAPKSTPNVAQTDKASAKIEPPVAAPKAAVKAAADVKTEPPKETPRTAPTSEAKPMKKDKEQKAEKETTKPQTAAPTSVSVLDRLRQKRSDSGAGSGARSEATLNDVAREIEANMSGATRSPASAAGAAWRGSVIDTISTTRQELKQAHTTVSRLRQRLADVEKSQKENRARMKDSLTKAEGLLHEIRDAWR